MNTFLSILLLTLEMTQIVDTVYYCAIAKHIVPTKAKFNPMFSGIHQNLILALAALIKES